MCIPTVTGRKQIPATVLNFGVLKRNKQQLRTRQRCYHKLMSWNLFFLGVSIIFACVSNEIQYIIYITIHYKSLYRIA